jgi:hypothetical protein
MPNRKSTTSFLHAQILHNMLIGHDRWQKKDENDVPADFPDQQEQDHWMGQVCRLTGLPTKPIKFVAE